MNTNLELAPRAFPNCIAQLGFTAQHAAIKCVFAARTACDDGRLHGRATHPLHHDTLQPRASGSGIVAGVPAVVGEAVQPPDFAPMVVRCACLEDGHRLVNLMLTAPKLLADSVRTAWCSRLQALTWETPEGSRFGVTAP